MYYIYILKSDANGQFYTGLTENLERRIKEHMDGSNRTTRNGKPWKLIRSEGFTSRIEARQRERYLKSGIGREWSDKIFKGK